MWIKPPEWTAPWDAHEPSAHGYGPAVPRAAAAYTLIQLAIALAAGFALLWPGFVAYRRLGALLAAFVLLSLLSLPALWDLRAWARRIEIARLALVMVGAGALALGGALSGLLAAVVLAGCVVSVATLATVADSRAMLAGDALVR